MSVWKIRDKGNEFEVKWEEAIERVLEGDISYFADVYDEKVDKWVPIGEKPEFAFAFPIFPFMELGDELKHFVKGYKKGFLMNQGFSGIVSIGPDWKELISIAKIYGEKGLPNGITFFVPVLNKDVKKRMTRPIKMFHLFDNFLVGSFFANHRVPASTETPLFAAAVNVSSSHASHSLFSYKFPIPESEKVKLKFDLPPKKWVFRRLRIDTTGTKYGPQKIEFRTASGKRRFGKTLLVSALTLGTIGYTPSYGQVSTSFEIIPPDTQKTATENVDNGELLYHMNDLAAAREELEAALDKEPNNPKAHRLLGTVYNLLEKNEKAECELKRAIELDKNDDVAHNNLAALYDKLNRTEEAEKEFREAIRIKPDDLPNHYDLAAFLKNRNRLDEAWNEYLEMLKLDPEFTPAYTGVYSLLAENKMEKERLRQIYLESERLFAEGIARMPNIADMHSYLGYVQLHLGKFKEAEREFKVALRLDQENQLAHIFLASKKKGEWEKIGIPE